MIKRVGVAISVYANEKGDERSPKQQKEKQYGDNAGRDRDSKAYRLLRTLLPTLERVDLSVIDESNNECTLGTFWYLMEMLEGAISVFKWVPEVIVGRSTLQKGVKDNVGWNGDIVESARARLGIGGGGGLMANRQEPKQRLRWVDVCQV